MERRKQLLLPALSEDAVLRRVAEHGKDLAEHDRHAAPQGVDEAPDHLELAAFDVDFDQRDPIDVGQERVAGKYGHILPSGVAPGGAKPRYEAR